MNEDEKKLARAVLGRSDPEPQTQIIVKDILGEAPRAMDGEGNNFDPGAIHKANICPDHSAVMKAQGEAEARARAAEKKADHLEKLIEEIFGKLGTILTDLAVLKLRVVLYGALVAVIVSPIVAAATVALIKAVTR
jgi:hypothetical protein